MDTIHDPSLPVGQRFLELRGIRAKRGPVWNYACLVVPDLYAPEGKIVYNKEERAMLDSEIQQGVAEIRAKLLDLGSWKKVAEILAGQLDLIEKLHVPMDDGYPDPVFSGASDFDRGQGGGGGGGGEDTPVPPAPVPPPQLEEHPELAAIDRAQRPLTTRQVVELPGAVTLGIVADKAHLQPIEVTLPEVEAEIVEGKPEGLTEPIAAESSEPLPWGNKPKEARPDGEV